MVPPDSRKIPRVPRYLGAPKASPPLFAYRTLTVYGRLSHAVRLNREFLTGLRDGSPGNGSPATPTGQRLPAFTPDRFRLLRVRSPLLTQSLLFSLRPVTKMFQFTGCPLPALCVQAGVAQVHLRRVTPFGNPRIKARLQLPEAYRRLPRPSSALCPQASTVRPL